MSDPVRQGEPRRGHRKVAAVRMRDSGPRGHEIATLEAMARRIARLRGADYAGTVDDPALHGERCYLIPEDTLSAQQARDWGVRDRGDLYGGVVPHRFVATKLVSHPALDEDASVPAGWSHALGAHLADAVLPGFAVFSADEARHACAQLLPLGQLRLKLARGVGGNDQFLLTSEAELDAALAQVPDDELPAHGATLEQHLVDATTCSIGSVECAGIRIAYAGTQRLVRNRHGNQVYGGSDLRVVRGDFDTLLALDLADHVRQALRQAQAYDAAMAQAFPGFFASRRNYDVVQGTDLMGQWRSGVLEQSWRIGGATPAELAALEAFAADPALDTVRASCREVHGIHTPPPGATVYYHDVDPQLGMLGKYAQAQVDGHPR